MTAFSAFDAEHVALGDDQVFVRSAGSGPPLLLLHGYPQTAAMWHQVAPTLSDHFTVIAPDLPGYGRSDAPQGGPARYAKRRLAADMVALMATLGHQRFTVVGHDRGARVGYRMALDHPVVERLAVLDIVPTGTLWARFNVDRAMTYYHWLFLAQPSPLPEQVIGADPVGYLDLTLASWTARKDLSAFDPTALAEYHAAVRDPEKVRAMCEDYRAGATLDRDHDDASVANGERLSCPLLVLWGDAFSAGGGSSPLDVWREWASDLSGHGLPSGHFVCEEAPADVLARLLPFLGVSS